HDKPLLFCGGSRPRLLFKFAGETPATTAMTGPLFRHRSRRPIHLRSTMIVTRRPDAQKDFKSVAGTVAIITVKVLRPNVDRELSAQSDVDVVTVGQIADVTD